VKRSIAPNEAQFLRRCRNIGKSFSLLCRQGERFVNFHLLLIVSNLNLQWGLTLTESLRPYLQGSKRKASSFGKKLSIPSTSRTPAASLWSTINKHTGRSEQSSRLPSVSAYSIASQLVKNGEHKAGDRESTRLVNKEVSDLWFVPAPERDSISALFFFFF